MNLSAKKITQKIFGSILLVLVGMLILNSSIYMHTHLLADGSIICHAHPYHKAQQNTDKAPSHHHTGAEIVFFQNLELLFFIATITAFAFLKSTSPVFQTLVIPAVRFTSFNIIRGRAPPVLFVS